MPLKTVMILLFGNLERIPFSTAIIAFEVEINWHQLLKLAAHQEYLVIYFKLQHNCGFYLEKTELAEEDFQRVISFVQ
jgi:hypothetical protein